MPVVILAFRLLDIRSRGEPQTIKTTVFQSSAIAISVILTKIDSIAGYRLAPNLVSSSMLGTFGTSRYGLKFAA